MIGIGCVIKLGIDGSSLGIVIDQRLLGFVKELRHHEKWRYPKFPDGHLKCNGSKYARTVNFPNAFPAIPAVDRLRGVQVVYSKENGETESVT